MALYLLECELRCLEDIHVGSGLVDPKSGAALLCRSGGSCVIPGSSLKGMIRTVVEYKHRNEPQEEYCFVLASERRSDLRWVGRLQRKLGLYNLRKGSCRGLCKICEVFGKPSRASKLMFSDATPQEAFVPELKSWRFGWKGEVFPKGTALGFEIATGDLNSFQLGSLLEGLRGLKDDWKHYVGLRKYNHFPSGGNAVIRIKRAIEREAGLGLRERDITGELV
jgi:hypothetical protein